MTFAVRLEVGGLGVARGGALIVDGASFSAGPGGAVLLRGANGAGKTSVLRAIAGLLPVAKGRIVIAGDGAAETAADRRMLAVYCGHADGVKAAMTGTEHLRFWRALYGAPRARVDEAATAFDLGGFIGKAAAALSAGQRRRLGLARLVIAGKPLWLLDEPTATIDVSSAERLSALVEQHRGRGGIVVVATHDRFELPDATRLLIGARDD